MRCLASIALVAVLLQPGLAVVPLPVTPAGETPAADRPTASTPAATSAGQQQVALHSVGTASQAATRAGNDSRLSETQLRDDEELVALIDIIQGKEALGQIVVRLHHRYAPQHVKNFVKLAENGFYDGTLFHCVSPESFIQGGDPLSRDADPRNDGLGGPGYDLAAEINEKENIRGSLVAVSTGDRDSGSQFFICLTDHPEWNDCRTVFGNVTHGMQIADLIAHARRKGERPVNPLAMKVTIEKRKRQLRIY